MSELDKYIDEKSTPEDELLKELDRQTHLKLVQPRMISGHIQGLLLKMLVKMYRPKNVLELGTFTGYSALSIASGLPEGGFLDTVEVDDEIESFTNSFFDKSAYRDKIKMHIGSALTLPPTLGKCFDMVFIDADKREYPDYYRMIMGDLSTPAIVKSGSVIIADNILWYGKVIEKIPANDKYTQGIVDFNALVASDSRVENMILNIRDGLNIILVK
ncbi:MAG: O-methyltransferase [Rikenellaceae bacterium]